MSPKQPDNFGQANCNQKSDAELFLLFQEGQKDVLAILYDRHAALVYGIALQLLKNTAEAEDLTQDIFLKLTNDSSYNPQRGSLRTFLAILTRCRALDRLRARTTYQRKLREQVQNEKERVNSAFPIEELSRLERSQEVNEALAQLSNKEQEVIKMAYYDGLSQSEISERLNIALGTIKSRSRRGLIKLRQALTNKSGGES